MKENLDLLLINPGNRKEAYGDLSHSLSGIEPPLWAGLIASFIRQHGYSVKIIDADAENLSPKQTAEKIAEHNPILADIVVLGTNPSASSTPKMTAVSETVKALRKITLDTKIALSGLHPSALPRRTLQEEDADFICVGEGFYTILHLLNALKSGETNNNYRIKGLWYKKEGRIISNQHAELVKNLDELPFAAWDLIPMNKYRAHNWHCFNDLDNRQPYAVIYTSLGCPFSCSYCPTHAFYGGPGICFRSPERVVEEIDFLVKNYNVKNIKIMDELFVLKEARIEKICNLIIQRGYKLNIWCYSRVDTVKEPLLKKMKNAGVNWIAYGIESASEMVRRGVNKKIEQRKIKRAIDITKAAGINIIGNFIFGLPLDNLETMQETLDMAKGFNFEYVNFYTAMAYPGSGLYDDAIKKGIKLPESWHGYSQYGEESLPLPTKYLSAKEVLRFRDKAFVEYFSNPEYIQMIREKFGPRVVGHINEMLEYKICRRYA